MGVALLAAGTIGWAASPWTVVAHLDGRGGLGAAAQSYIDQLGAARSRLAGLAVQRVRESPDGSARVRRWLVAADGTRTDLQDAGDLASGESSLRCLRTFAEWARQRRGYGPVLLLYLGHGVGLTAGEGRDGYAGLAGLRRALQPAGEGSDKPYAVLALDTCFGGSLETAYELRGVARYLTAAPGLVDSPGLDWQGALQDADVAGDDGASLVRAVVSRGMVRPTGSHRGLVGVDLQRSSAAAAAMSRLAAALRDDIAGSGPAIALVRSRSQGWGEHDELCDVGQWVSGMAVNGGTEQVRRAAREAEAAIAEMTVASWTGEGMETGNLARLPSALGVFFPSSLEETPASYETQLQFPAATGWADFLTDYWGWARGQLLGAAPRVSAAESGK